jgi:hypothetical protein
MVLEQDVGLILGFGDWMGPGFCLVLALAPWYGDGHGIWIFVNGCISVE